MLRKLSIVPVALIALYLFGCNLQSGTTPSLLEEESIAFAFSDMAGEPVSLIVEEPVFVVVDEMPKFPGGDEALLRFIRANIVYPEKAKANNVQGRVVLQFVITAMGTVDEVKIYSGVDPELDAEAVRIIKLLKFIPGEKGGVAVPVAYSAPVTFQL